MLLCIADIMYPIFMKTISTMLSLLCIHHVPDFHENYLYKIESDAKCITITNLYKNHVQFANIDFLLLQHCSVRRGLDNKTDDVLFYAWNQTSKKYL
jgi:hypothetical protein